MKTQKAYALRCADLCGMAALSYPIILNLVRAVISLVLGYRVPGASLANPVGISQGMAISLNLLAGTLALLLPGVIAAKTAGLTLKKMKQGKRTSWKNLKRWLALFLATASAANLVGVLVSKALKLQSSPYMQLPAAGWELLLAFIALCLFPAVSEELFFRGVLQGLLRPMGKGAAVIGTAVIFGLLHGSLAGCISAFFCGLVLSSCAQATQSLLPGMLLHFVNNLLAFVGLYLAQYGSVQAYQILLFTLPLVGAGAELLHQPLKIDRAEKTAGRLTESRGYNLAVIALVLFCLLRSMEAL